MKGVMVSLPHRAGVTSNTALLAFWSTRLTSLNNGEVGPEVGPQELRRGFQMLLAEKNAPLKVTLILVVRFAVVWSAVMEVTVPRLNTRYLNVFVIPGARKCRVTLPAPIWTICGTNISSLTTLEVFFIILAVIRPWEPRVEKVAFLTNFRRRP